LIEVWTTGRTEAEVAVAHDEPRIREASSCIAQIAADPEQQMLVADADGTVMGAVHLRRGRISPIQQAEAVHVTHLHVHPRYRRRGIASALLAAATAWADEKDSAHLVAVAPSSSREAQRFLARLGFSQVAVVRAVATTALRHRFTTAAVSRDTSRLLATRRTLRRRREHLATG
jgi:ribosomal protein S18 acetylase RimI-like enzyme